MADPDNHHSNSKPESPATDSPWSHEEWEQLPTDPDLQEDLGYEMLELTVHSTDDDRIIFLPQDEEVLREEAFIVARRDDVQLFR